MGASLIIQLITTLGPSAVSLITQLITAAENNQNVTAAQWSAMIAGIEASNASVEMAKALQAAGIAPTDPRYIALVGATKPA